MLQGAKGEYVVIYDAEDRPDPAQLKKAVLMFDNVDESIVCIQAKLNFFNQQTNFLTRWFSIEYSMLFDLGPGTRTTSPRTPTSAYVCIRPATGRR